MSGAAGRTVLVLTALDVEYAAVRVLLNGLRDDRHPSGTIFEVGHRAGRAGRVVLGETGPGNQAAAVLTERAINHYSPAAILLVGIAGALHGDLALGDVVIGTKIYFYQGGTEGPAGFRARPQSWEAPYALLQVARALHRSGRLPRPSTGVDGRRATIHFRPIAAGDVVLNAPDTPLAMQLRVHYEDAAAIEMEGAGTAKAAHWNGAVPVLDVRGISDTVAQDKMLTDRSGWRETAAGTAAAAAAELIDEFLGDVDPHREGLRPGPAAAGRPTAVLTGVRRPLGLEPLSTVPAVTWRRSLPGTWRNDMERAALEVHLVPAGPGGRLEMRDVRSLPDQLVARGRGAVFTASEGVETGSDQQVAWARGTGYDPGPRGVAVTRDGQRSAWSPLPHDGLGAVLDPEEITGQVLMLLRLLTDLPVPSPEQVAPALAIAPAQSVCLDSVGRMPRTSASMGWRQGDEVTVAPEDRLGFPTVRDRADEVADELASRLVAAFRAAR